MFQRIEDAWREAPIVWLCGVRRSGKMPKAYAFDTGFVSFARGWDPLRQEDPGLLWDHLLAQPRRAWLSAPHMALRNLPPISYSTPVICPRLATCTVSISTSNRLPPARIRSRSRSSAGPHSA